MFDIDKYISYFGDKNIKFIIDEKYEDGERIKLPYPDYDSGMKSFIKDIYESGLILNNYDELIGGEIAVLLRNGSLLAELDYRRACAALTWIVRSDRFSPLSLGREADKGNLNILLSRIRDTKESS